MTKIQTDMRFFCGYRYTIAHTVTLSHKISHDDIGYEFNYLKNQLLIVYILGGTNR